MKKIIITFSLIHLSTYPLFASDCLQYKTNPVVQITTTEWTREVAGSDNLMDSLHGVVIASFDEEYDLRVSAQPANDGYCVVLNALDATIGYTDFLVNIDASHAPGSKQYDVILAHEDRHIAAHIAALESEFQNIKSSIEVAANSIMPVFVRSLDGVGAALDTMQQELQSHPDIILMKQKLNAEQEIRNKKVDMR